MIAPLKEIILRHCSTSKHLIILSAVDIVEKDQKNTQCFYKISAQLPELARKIISVL